MDSVHLGRWRAAPLIRGDDTPLVHEVQARLQRSAGVAKAAVRGGRADDVLQRHDGRVVDVGWAPVRVRERRAGHALAQAHLRRHPLQLLQRHPARLHEAVPAFTAAAAATRAGLSSLLARACMQGNRAPTLVSDPSAHQPRHLRSQGRPHATGGTSRGTQRPACVSVVDTRMRGARTRGGHGTGRSKVCKGTHVQQG